MGNERADRADDGLLQSLGLVGSNVTDDVGTAVTSMWGDIAGFSTWRARRR